MNQQNLDLEVVPDQWQFRYLEKYLTASNNKELIYKAWDFAKVAHSDQKRISGENYLVHPVWVAKVVAQLNLGDEAICTALLHDTVEDTSVTPDLISQVFGDEIALLVAGLTDVRAKTKDIVLHEENIEVFKNFLFSSVNDVRVLIIRLIDKLHNGLTISAMPMDKQIRYAKRVLGVYAPVAEYVGLHYFKKILEDIAFEILYPKEVGNVKKVLAEQARLEELSLPEIKEAIAGLLKINHLGDFEIQGRVKSLYSTYKKIKQGLTANPLKDRVGIRILVNSVAECYQVLSLLHAQNKYIETEFDDYITTPKSNGYRTIQTTIVWRDVLNVEIQIRTYEMHDFNEFGPASHIAYKLQDAKNKNVGYEWVRDLVSWEKNKSDGVNSYKISVLKNYIYVFTPKGDVVQLPSQATALDFAYYIHKEVGNRCIGAKINNKMGKVSDVLANGDLVEILLGTKPNINRDWLGIAKTKHALEQIKKSLSYN